MILAFGGFELNRNEFELRHNGEPVAIEPQVLDVLSHLASNHGRLVTKNELLDEVWGDRFVSDSALTSRIKLVRRTLGDDARAPRFVQTVHGRGYRFIHEVTEHDDSPTGPAGAVRDAAGHSGLGGPVGGAGGRRPGPAPPPDGTLPRLRTPLLGRQDVLAEIVDRVTGHRFVSLIGLGGAGKTKLAVAAGHEACERFPDGVWFVDLVPCSNRSAVETAFAHTVGLGSSDEAARAVDGRRALFILDNCEHVLGDAAAFVDELLAATSGPHVLTTCREPLGLIDEHQIRVGQLDRKDGVELLRLAASRVGVDLEADERAALVCERLDDLPLAIELAGAQLRHLPIDDVADRLQQRLDLVAATGRGADGRHSSLAAILDDTWDLLDRDEAELLAQLAAFPGTFRPADVEDLTEDRRSIGRLGQLVDRSLVTRTADGRLRVLETVRLHAGERSDAPAARQRHADWCHRTVGDDFEVHFSDFRHALWCIEHFDDLGAAQRTCLDLDDVHAAARLAAAQALAMHLDVGARAAAGHREIVWLLTQVEQPELVVKLHVTAALCGMAMRRPDLIRRHGIAAVAMAETEVERLAPPALVLRSWSSVFESTEKALAQVERAAALAAEHGSVEWGKVATSYRAMHTAMARRPREAAKLARSVLEAIDRDRPTYGAYSALACLAAVDLLRAGPEATEWATILMNAPKPEYAMWSNQLVAASLFASSGDVAEVRRLVGTVRRRLDQAGLDALPDLLVPIAALAHHVGDDERTKRWLRAVRDAELPTQSFSVTIIYGMLRSEVGISDEPVLASHSLDAIGAEAEAWLESVAEAP